MAKLWLAIREKSILVLRRSFIVSLSLTAVVGAMYLAKPVLWSGGFGIGKDQSVTTESIEIDAKGKISKSVKTIKYDDGKTLWDWLSLLGVPLSLAILGYWLQQNQQKRAEEAAKEQREIAAGETKEEILQIYIDRLSKLLVDKNLLGIVTKKYIELTQENQLIPSVTVEEKELLDSAVHVIRAMTLSILRRFENDPERKTSVIRFLIESDIVTQLELSLKEVDLSEANLSVVYLPEANLSGANLSGANLCLATLSKANLVGANLVGANLSKADLSEAYLIKADLSDANLVEANLHAADLSDANLLGTNLSGANLSRAKFGNNRGLSELDKADFRGRGAIFDDDPNS
jgi:hypothetical protein